MSGSVERLKGKEDGLMADLGEFLNLSSSRRQISVQCNSIRLVMKGGFSMQSKPPKLCRRSLEPESDVVSML